MSSKMSGPQRRRAENAMTNSVHTDALARDDARILNPTGGDRVDNEKEARAIADPARQAAIAAANTLSRDRWNALLSAQAGRTIFVKSSGWQRVFDGQQGHGGSVG